MKTINYFKVYDISNNNATNKYLVACHGSNVRLYTNSLKEAKEVCDNGNTHYNKIATDKDIAIFKAEYQNFNDDIYEVVYTSYN